MGRRYYLNYINIISSVMAKNSNKELNPKQIKNLTIINKSGQDLLSLINDILDVSKIEAGKLPIYFEKVNLNTLSDELYESMKPIAKDKGITLIKNITLNDDPIVSDAKRIKQVIQNLLSNAIKFTPKGSVEFNITQDNKNIIIHIIIW